MGLPRFRIVVCRGPECGAKWHSQEIYETFARVIKERGLEDRVKLERQSCFGRCRQGPNVLISEIPENEGGGRFLFASPLARRGRSALYNQLKPRDVVELIEEHVLHGRFVRRLIHPPGQSVKRADPGSGSHEDGDS